ncbi:ABC transporter permease [Beijerinckiaceae bacterium RH AL1]|nr:ABC transporter permease [Beijerinckiaceae bacterium]VVB44565.1 ABC transporter permease [Beijerinckiaceae bacterium RH CH11]VVB44644.1 ABC transporter permease [Beijerinckiaceae bacterium RH AL8]VVC54422.1 ABC transporter permease [Beijerinckiaceae bacterium RH AL1]
MTLIVFTNVVLSIIVTSTPLLLAATGELVVEKSGVLNLGVEGMMLVGAVCGFALAFKTGSPTLGVLGGMVAGALFSLLFSVLALSFLAAQVPAGLVLTIFGTGLSALIGSGFVGNSTTRLPQLDIPGLSHLPVIGPVLFGEDILVYLSFAAVVLVHIVLTRTHAGLVLRAVGDSADAGHALGYDVIKVRYLATTFGGAMAGLAGAYMSLAYNTSWAENMTAGRGWIALALVVFSMWRPFWLVLGAYLFGAIMYMSFYLQGLGVAIPSQFISALPYIATIVVLVIISSNKARIRLTAPACLGKTFHATS